MMDCFEQLNKLFKNEDHNSIIKSQIIGTFDYSNSTTSIKAVNEEKKSSPIAKRLNKLSDRFPTTKNNSELEENQKIRVNKLTSTATNNKSKPLGKMADWSDEDSTEVIGGKGFGVNNNVYKSNDDYQNENDDSSNFNADGNGDDYNKKRYNDGDFGGGGSDRGRSGNRGGRGRNRNGFDRYNKDNDGNEGNFVSNTPTSTASPENYQNSIFALTPKDFSKETLQNFLKNMSDLFRKASLVQKYTLMRYLMEAYEKILKKCSEKTRKVHYKKHFRRKEKSSQQLETSFRDLCTTVRTYEVGKDEVDQEFSEMPTLFRASMSSPSSEKLDLLNMYQQDLNKQHEKQNSSLTIETQLMESQENSDLLFQPCHTNLMNISDLFGNKELNKTAADLHVTLIKQNQQKSEISSERENELIKRRHSERLQTKEYQHSACVKQTSHSSNSHRLRYSLRLPHKTQSTLTVPPYLNETPPLTPTRQKPRRTFITEEEYSLRFRLPRRRFVEISELPYVKYTIETSTFSYFLMDMTLIEDEYLCECSSHMTTIDNDLIPSHSSTTISAMITNDNHSSLNVVRQAPSSMKELSSFGRPLQATAIEELSRFEDERNKSVHHDMSPQIENIVVNNDANISIDYILSVGEILQQSQPRDDPSQLRVEPITMDQIEIPPQIASAFTLATPDSGIQLPTPILKTTVRTGDTLTTDSGLMQPLSSNIGSTGPQANRLHSEPIRSDSGVFKTPMIPPKIFQAPKTTSASAEGLACESNLKTHLVDSSTPLKLPFLKRKQVLLVEMENKISTVTDFSEGVMSQNNQQSEAAVSDYLKDQLLLQPIAEVREDVRPSELLTTTVPIQSTETGEMNTGNVFSQAINNNNDDYRKDWYEILRNRLQTTHYEGCAISQRKRKHRRPNRRQSLHAELHAGDQNKATDEQQSTTKLFQQTLAGILPPLPTVSRKEITNQNLNTSIGSVNNIEVLPSPIISPEQQQYDQFILNNVENITKIVDNLYSCHLMLENYRRGLEKKLNTGNFNQPCYHFDPEVLLNAPKERLEIKLSLVQNIIRQVTFDFTKCECIKDRMSAAMGFAFLLELKSAGYNGERRNGFGGNRGRNTCGRGTFRDGGRRELHSNEGRGGEYGEYNNSGGGSNFEGEEPKKPREFYIPPEPTDNEDEIFGSGIISGINFSKYDSIPVKVTGENAPNSIQSFEEANLRDIVLNNIKRSGYKIPTPIQKTAIPVILSGRDLMACAQTGSGKTAAFLLPIINSLLSEGSEISIGKPHALIVSPTRELAIQIFNEARKFSLGSYLNIRIVYGGTSSKHQGENIGRGGSHILICTPGRLLDFVEKGFITFEETRFIVLDEADRMLDMGFKDSISIIMNHPTMRPLEERQNLMFSATFPEEIQRMAGEYLNEYIFISIGVVGGACSDVTQNIYKVKKFQKRAKLMELLQENPDGTIVFVETKRGADFLASLLSETEFPTTSIHGDRLQRQREMALSDFKSGKMKVLIATSVAARGLDIKNVNHVVNYDMPSSIDEYVHRIGRTGRVGNNGRATSFFDPDTDTGIAADLVNILKGSGQGVPDFLKNYSSGEGGGGNNYGSKFGGRDVRKGVTQIDDNFITSSGPSALEEDEEWN